MKQKLIIPLLSGETFETEAEIVGDLGVHPTRLDPKTYSVVHVPTLLSFTAAVPLRLRGNKKDLIAWCRRAQETFKRDWLAMRHFRPEDIKRDPDYSAKVRERIRNHCLTMEK